jgi:creatinine amidohydrolase
LLSAHEAGAAKLAIANAHFEPAHVDALFAAVKLVKERVGANVAFPHAGSKKNAERLARAAAPLDGHSGIYETSLMLAISPRLVRGHTKLPAVEASLASGIVAGATCFEEAGGHRAYFGNPAKATPELGHLLLEELASIMVDSLR